MKKLTLKTKLIGGFAVAAVITLLVGFNGWQGASRLTGHLQQIGKVNLPAIQRIGNIVEGSQAIEVTEASLLNPNLNRERREKLYGSVSQARGDIQKARAVYETLPRTPDEENLWKQFIPALESIEKENELFLEHCRELDKTRVLNPLAFRGLIEKFKGDHYKLTSLTAIHISSTEPFEGGEDSTQCAFGKWMAGFTTENTKINNSLKEIVSHHNLFHQSVKKIKEQVKAGDQSAAIGILKEDMGPAAERTFKQFDAISEEVSLAESIYARMNEAMDRIQVKQHEADKLLGKMSDLSEQISNAAVDKSDGEATTTKLIALVGMGVGFSLALILGTLLSYSITKSLGRVIEGISEGAGQVASAANQVASASQQLAEGTSRQAASIEETSASLEEMAAMTVQNADNANLANKLMLETTEVVSKANQSMEELTASMLDISRASEETSKIIKTIDEIAFQTNLLALNAAVEAARAGEAGAGFAVVADEVRSLAMRAADAAKNTAGLIEGTVRKIKGGSEVVQKTSAGFSQVAGSAAKIGELVGEITAASSEQAQGIEQINKAVSEMDKVVQQNAANAEESASASEEMNAQAEQMKDYVQELVQIVGNAAVRAAHHSKKSTAGNKRITR
ncbi:MAG: methyl-accepting chemotaxis protein [Syntrophobacteraceae bacterium]